MDTLLSCVETKQNAGINTSDSKRFSLLFRTHKSTKSFKDRHQELTSLSWQKKKHKIGASNMK
jgi:hypothetical protein